MSVSPDCPTSKTSGGLVTHNLRYVALSLPGVDSFQSLHISSKHLGRAWPLDALPVILHPTSIPGDINTTHPSGQN